LSVDPQVFQARLYVLLQRLPASGPPEWTAALEAVAIMLLQRREVHSTALMLCLAPFLFGSLSNAENVPFDDSFDLRRSWIGLTGPRCCLCQAPRDDGAGQPCPGRCCRPGHSSFHCPGIHPSLTFSCNMTSCARILHSVPYSQRYPKVQQLLSNETVQTGVYRPDATQPDLANPFATTLWEVALMAVSGYPMLPCHCVL